MIRIRRETAALFMVMTMIGPYARAQDHNAHISQSQIDEMFTSMRANTQWNVDGSLLWGYYFTATDRASLDLSAKILSTQGYSFVNIRKIQAAKGSTPAVWQLHVERVEHHTPESLFARNAEFYAFAESHGLATYDGMDAGPAK